MLYNIGDIVTVRKALCYFDDDGNYVDYIGVGQGDTQIDPNGNMKNFAGELVTINAITSYDKYVLKESSSYVWVDGMFEESLTKNKYRKECKNRHHDI